MNQWMSIGVAAFLCGAACQAQTNQSTVVTSTATATNEPTIITSDRAQYMQSTVTFEGNVLAVDPRITVRADKVVAYFAMGTNVSRQVQPMVATGSVLISQDDRKATSENAEYFAAENKVTLTGNPKVETPQGTISGQRITFWQGQEKMDVDSGSDTNRTRLIFYPGEQRKKDE